LSSDNWVEPEQWLEQARSLAAGGWILADLTSVDLLGITREGDNAIAWRGAGFGPDANGVARSEDHRFEVVVQLRHHEDRQIRTVHIPAPGEPPTIPSVTSVWGIANFLEREVFDLMGVHFEGHPNLVRILMPDEWEGHPLRKDYGVGKVPIEFVPQPFMQISGPGQAPSGEETDLELDRLGQVVTKQRAEADAPGESTRRATKESR
jgi:NADH:ubiquinone oxidoreductase subunit C